MDKGVLALGGQNFEEKHNNQIVIGIRGGRDVEEEVRPMWSAGGGGRRYPIDLGGDSNEEKKQKYNTPWP